jgi:hypothetical protein
VSERAPSPESVASVAELLDHLERRPDLAIDADLTVRVDGMGLTVVGYEALVAVDCPSVATAVRLVRRHRSRAMDLAAGLSSAGLTAEIRVRGVPLARLGEQATPNALAAWLGLDSVELVPEGALLAAVTRRRG